MILCPVVFWSRHKNNKTTQPKVDYTNARPATRNQGIKNMFAAIEGNQCFTNNISLTQSQPFMLYIIVLPYYM
jgi:hypothetical protein